MAAASVAMATEMEPRTMPARRAVCIAVSTRRMSTQGVMNGQRQSRSLQSNRKASPKFLHQVLTFGCPMSSLNGRSDGCFRPAAGPRCGRLVRGGDRVQIGLQIPDFTWPGGPAQLGADLATVAAAADDAGFDFISVMDHFFQIGGIGPPEREMLEAYTTLGYLAGCTSRAKLLTLVTGTVYRHPGILAKIITTLDVLSGGRAWLGIGAAWNEEESRGLGIPFPPVAERFERLEETLQICLQMWHGDEKAYRGRHYTLERTLNSPQSLTRPHPPIMIGGGGEQKTLRVVARYAQACNLFPGPDLARKLDVLRAPCDAEGRDYDEIIKTCYFLFDVGERGERAGQVVDQLGALAEMGFQAAIGGGARVWEVRALEGIGGEVIPAVAGL